MNKQYKLKTIALMAGTVLSMMGSTSAFSAATTATPVVGGAAATAASINNVVGAVNDNAALTDTNTGVIGTNGTAITDNAGVIGTNGTAISDNGTLIGNNGTAITANGDAITAHGTRLATLEGASTGTASPVTINCGAGVVGAITSAIASASPFGPLVVTLDGNCTENVEFARDNVTIQGLGGDDSLTGVINTKAVIGTVARNVIIDELTITGGLFGIAAVNNSTVTLTNTTISGAVYNSSLGPLTGLGVFANAGSVITLGDGNTLSGDSADGLGLVALSNSSLVWGGGNNVVNGLGAFLSSAVTQLTPGTGNEVNLGLEITDGSSAFFQQVAIDINFMELWSASGLVLGASSASAITVALTGINPEIFIAHGSTLDLDGEDGNFPVSITNLGGTAVIQLMDHASIFFAGSDIDADFNLFRGSSIDGGAGASITGDLTAHNYSSVSFVDALGAVMTTGTTITCGAAEVFIGGSDNCNITVP